MTSKEKHAKYYRHEREHDWQKQEIKNASYALFLHLLEVQNYHCPICNSVINEHASLDHNHKTGLVRGVLCNRCNLNLARIETMQNPDGSRFLDTALQYLQAY